MVETVCKGKKNMKAAILDNSTSNFYRKEVYKRGVLQKFIKGNCNIQFSVDCQLEIDGIPVCFSIFSVVWNQEKYLKNSMVSKLSWRQRT